MLNPDLAGFLALARAGYHSDRPTQVEVDAEAMASATLEHCLVFDDSALRGLTQFIAISRVQPERAHGLLQD